jgi:hypothetical protein
MLFILLLAAAPVMLAESIDVDLDPCKSERPESPYDLPLCADYELNSVLIKYAEAGDASAIVLLRERYKLVDTHSERHRIAGALLKDPSIWNDILAEAELAVQVPAEFEEWCEQRGFDPLKHRSVLYDALAVATRDKRVVPLLVKALETEDESVAYIAVAGLAIYRHSASRPAIDELIKRFPSLESDQNRQ